MRAAGDRGGGAKREGKRERESVHHWRRREAHDRGSVCGLLLHAMSNATGASTRAGAVWTLSQTPPWARAVPGFDYVSIESLKRRRGTRKLLGRAPGPSPRYIQRYINTDIEIHTDTDTYRGISMQTSSHGCTRPTPMCKEESAPQGHTAQHTEIGRG